MAPSITVYPLQWQSHGITLSDWISLFTLSLAPLIAHIVAGVPQTSYLDASRPRWHEVLGHYNPTSILWRYAIITDRRIRARAWNRADMAASNTTFWTSRGWDGSEAMVVESLPHCVHLPEHARIKWFSREMIKTVVVTLQGTQALYLLIYGFTNPNTNFINTLAVNTIFFPLAWIGLLRLCCGLWLTDDYVYTALDDVQGHDMALRHMSTFSIDCSVEQHDPNVVTTTEKRFKSPSNWPSKLFRAAFMVPIVGMLLLAIFYSTPALPGHYGMVWTVTQVLFAALYLFFLFMSSIVLIRYLAAGHTTTIIPCVNAIWYKVYSSVLIALGVILIAVACVETKKTPCGTYTGYPGLMGDSIACYQQGLVERVVPMGKPGEEFTQGFGWDFGIASTYPSHNASGANILGPGESWVYNFTGYCLGVDNGHMWQLTETLDVQNIRTVYNSTLD
ncbi:hypothetical protein F5Y15DRAFT_233327 [Xylariaceae sp. FL0016]|nr:hypothetical protein F5Y15DRAFT_233327 [Xylariaceae sp. FL0016]